MRTFSLIIILVLLQSCQSENSKAGSSQVSTYVGFMENTFFAIDSLLKVDNGEFWGENLYGPILLVDPESRILYANENNRDKGFEKVGSIYTDSLPTEINMANTAFDWDGKRWSMVMLQLPKDKMTRHTLLIHELFHRLQPELGFENIPQLDNVHLDSYESRLLLKLELEALNQALTSSDEHILAHVSNALFFRRERQYNQDIKNAENALELNEGIAEYTAIMLSGRSPQEMTEHLSQSKTEFYDNPTFVRSFAYQTIPMYGYLLSLQKKNWQHDINVNTNLTEYLTQSFGIVSDTKRSIEEIALENDYDYKQIKQVEIEREKLRLKKISELKTKFIESPTLDLVFESMNISFDPRNLIPLDNYGTIYPTMRVTDNWGILTVENEALLAPDWSKVTLIAPTRVSDSVVNGQGWTLELNPGWFVRSEGNSFVLVQE